MSELNKGIVPLKGKRIQVPFMIELKKGRKGTIVTGVLSCPKGEIITCTVRVQ